MKRSSWSARDPQARGAGPARSAHDRNLRPQIGGIVQRLSISSIKRITSPQTPHRKHQTPTPARGSPVTQWPYAGRRLLPRVGISPALAIAQTKSRAALTLRSGPTRRCLRDGEANRAATRVVDNRFVPQRIDETPTT